MANNPYQQPQTMDTLPPEPRVSALAVCSLVFGLVCCIPGSGLLATILGGAGMVRISKSEGRLSGRTLSFIGIALGIMSTTVWLALAVGTAQAVSAFKNGIAEPASAAVRAMEGADWATARKFLDARAAGKLTDEQIQTFRDEVAQKFGAFVGTPQKMNITELLNGPKNLNIQPGTHGVIPAPVEFKNGQAWVVVMTESQYTIWDILLTRNGSIQGKVINIGVIGEGKEFWLIDPAAKSKTLPPASPKTPVAPSTPEKPAGG